MIVCYKGTFGQLFAIATFYSHTKKPPRQLNKMH